MTLAVHRVAAFAALALLLFGLAACGDSEADQRKAFMSFLQTRIVDRPGVHIPKPTDEDIKSFGDYAAHYAVITDFTGNQEMLGMGKTIEKIMGSVSLGTMQDFVDHRAEYRTVLDELRKIRVKMNAERAKTDARHTALKQPDDLKAVYDKAYDKVIVAPTEAMNNVLGITDDVAAASLKLGDYIDAHRSKVVMSGKNVGGKDPQTVNDINGLIKNLTSYTPQFRDAQHRLQLVLQGN